MPDPLSATLSALADPTRRAILARLSRGEACVNDLAAPFSISQPAISKHLKVLEKAGLIARGREAQWRPCRLDAAPLRDVANWLENYRRFARTPIRRLVRSKGRGHMAVRHTGRRVEACRNRRKTRRRIRGP